MSLRPTRFSPARRRLLCATGAATLLMSPLARAVGAARSSPLRVGVVLPRSHRYPELPDRFVAGLESLAACAGNEHAPRSLEFVPVACGSGLRAALVAATQAIRDDGVDLLAGFGRHDLASHLTPLLESHRTPFVMSDLGADVVRKRRESPYLIRNSLGYWQANYSMGHWAAANLGRRVLIATDFLESGYDMVYAFRRAFEEAGGEIARVQVTGVPDQSAPLEAVADAVRSHRPDFVYAFYSGKRAQAFLHLYESEGLANIAPLAGAGLLADSAMSSGRPAAFEGLVTASPWSSDIDSAENVALRQACRTAGGADADLFTVLGYETAQRIAMGVAALGGDTRDGARLAHSIGRADYRSVRGAVVIDGEMAESSAPAYVRRLSSRQGRVQNLTIARLPALRLAPETRQELRSMVKSGWSHGYLAA
jgi:ABC-type branched-subunit amino acid transport system substrate-binding protein